MLTMEDVSAALGEYGVDVRKPPYFQGGAPDPATEPPAKAKKRATRGKK